jgi:hypothetical protein
MILEKATNILQEYKTNEFKSDYQNKYKEIIFINTYYRMTIIIINESIRNMFNIITN